LKAIALALSLATLTGCSYPSDMNVAKAKFMCKGDDGMYKFHQTGDNVVECNNGKRFDKSQLEAVIITSPEYLPRMERGMKHTKNAETQEETVRRLTLLKEALEIGVQLGVELNMNGWVDASDTEEVRFETVCHDYDLKWSF